MSRATLTVTIPSTVWIGSLSRAYPDTTFRVLAIMPRTASGVGLLSISGPGTEGVIGELPTQPGVIDFQVLQANTETALLQFETTDETLLTPIAESGTPFELPITVEQGKARIEITAPRDRLSRLTAALEDDEIDFSVDRVVGSTSLDRPLTDRQRTLIQAAVEAGYYDTPRACSLTELANEVGLAKSTCSETLHRAEGRIIKRFLESEPLAAG